jgi:hypothetical protein
MKKKEKKQVRVEFQHCGVGKKETAKLATI